MLYLLIFLAHIIHYLRSRGVQTTQQKDSSNGVTTTVILYNKRELREDSTWFSSDLLHMVREERYNLWIDLTTAATDIHSLPDLERIKQSFCLEEDA